MNAIYKNLVTSLTEALDAVKFDKKNMQVLILRCHVKGAYMESEVMLYP